MYVPKLCVHQKNRLPNSASAYYLGSAESPTADFFQVWLKSSRSGDVASRSCSPQVIWRLRPPSLYGRRLSRTVPAVVPAPLVKISAPCPNICRRTYFQHFLGKSQKSIWAYKCPITAQKIRTWSQKLSKFSCNTFKPLNRGRPRFWARSLKTVPFQQWVVRGCWGGGVQTQLASLITFIGGGCAGGGGGCMHVVLHHVSLSHISVLL